MCKYNDLLSFLIEALKDYIEASQVELLLEAEIDGIMDETSTQGDFEILNLEIMTDTEACFILSASNHLRVITHIYREDFTLLVDRIHLG